MTFRKLLFILLLLSFGCIDNFPIEDNEIKPQPVIEGLITNEPGSSFVRVSTTASLGSNSTNNSLSSGAVITVTDNNGIITPFCEKQEGVYKPEQELFAGTVGMEYTLRIVLADDRIFESTAEKLQKPLIVDSVLVEFEPTLIEGTEQVQGNHRFFATVSSDQQDEPFFFRTSTLGIAQVAGDIQNPPPFQCLTGEFCVEFCWSFRKPIDQNIRIGSSRNTVNNTTTIEVGNQIYDFNSFYFMEVTVYSLNKAGFNFWQSLVDQQGIKGSIFDPQISDLADLNIVDLETNIPVKGHFSASGVSKGSIFFNRGVSAGFNTAIPEVQFTCTEAWPNSTLEIPPQFE
ncbi:DUF4249 domain-containing protein [Fulvivirga sp. M361]|uniref:DUF4249 family protein n=1 Tax=Fulvivirga sp. M361 TaxID=2594266 RepID=UPI001179A2A0|nr:DUF4249 family protein [Fulvivirga sp. M361]TRX62203.1 DUF4249 domain-containing protein [Fulvivirga sp. M361]